VLTSDVVLRDLLLSQPLGQHVVHGLGRIQDGEREIRLVLGEGVDALIIRIIITPGHKTQNHLFNYCRKEERR